MSFSLDYNETGRGIVGGVGAVWTSVRAGRALLLPGDIRVGSQSFRRATWDQLTGTTRSKSSLFLLHTF